MPLLRWVFLVGPARAYKRGEEVGRAPILHLLVLVAAGALGGLVGTLVALLLGHDPGTGFGNGIFLGLLPLVGWFLYVLALVAVMRLRHRPLEELVGSGWLRRPRRWWDR